MQYGSKSTPTWDYGWWHNWAALFKQLSMLTRKDM